MRTTKLKLLRRPQAVPSLDYPIYVNWTLRYSASPPLPWRVCRYDATEMPVRELDLNGQNSSRKAAFESLLLLAPAARKDCWHHATIYEAT
jgi:hypothetical protein